MYVAELLLFRTQFCGCKSKLLFLTPMIILSQIFFLLYFISLAVGVEDEKPPVTIKSTFKDGKLQKRAVHRESPLIYFHGDHPSEHYWTQPYYPSRV